MKQPENQQKFSGKTILENLPQELLTQPRFFPVRITKDGRKLPCIKAWQLPNNQMTAQDAIKKTGLIGMDICGHGLNPDYFFVDFDHVKDQSGNFLYEDAERWNNYLSTAETFSETSISKDGTHYLFCPTPNLFPTLTGFNGGNAIYFDETKKGKDAPKIELFYKSAGRYILLTGDGAPNTEILSGDPADEYCQHLCNQLALDTSQIKNAIDTNETPIDSDISIEEVKKMLAVIPCANVTYADWFKVAAILHLHFGSAGFELWRAWSETDPKRYTLAACQKQWRYLDNRPNVSRPATIGSLIFFAKKFGYHPPKKSTNQIAINANDSIEDIQAKIRGLCEWARDKNGNPTKIKPTVQNYKLIFNNDPNLKGLFGRDDFRQEIVFKRRAVWHSKHAPLKDSWDDTDDAELRLYLAEFYAEMPTLQRTLDYTTRVAGENSFHAIKQFFEALPKWDGTDRMETIFCKFLGADDTPYTRAVTKHFFLGAIARAFYPGCDFQSVPVLQGAQGIGKSRVLRMLGGKHGVNPKGESWHIALRDQLDDSHAVDAMRKGWIVEIEEFAAGSRADVNAMKGVLSADDVTRRFAYDRRAKTVKSHWVFIATCNDDAPLRDQTGARRFLPIKCHNKESTIVEGMTPEYIQQVWAEAYLTFKEMFPTVDSFDADKLRLPTDIQKQAADKAAGITQEDGLTTEIKGFIDQKILPLVIWNLLSREERRKFFVNGGGLIMVDALTEFNHRRRARGGKPDDVQHDVNLIYDFLNGTAGKNFVRIEKIKRGDNVIDEYHIYGSELRQHICAGEIYQECFGADRRKNMNRISEILSRLDGWTLGERLRDTDPTYPDQKKPYYRN